MAERFCDAVLHKGILCSSAHCYYALLPGSTNTASGLSGLASTITVCQQTCLLWAISFYL